MRVRPYEAAAASHHSCPWRGRAGRRPGVWLQDTAWSGCWRWLWGRQSTFLGWAGGTDLCRKATWAPVRQCVRFEISECTTLMNNQSLQCLWNIFSVFWWIYWSSKVMWPISFDFNCISMHICTHIPKNWHKNLLFITWGHCFCPQVHKQPLIYQPKITEVPKLFPMEGQNQNTMVGHRPKASCYCNVRYAIVKIQNGNRIPSSLNWLTSAKCLSEWSGPFLGRPCAGLITWSGMVAYKPITDILITVCGE